MSSSIDDLVVTLKAEAARYNATMSRSIKQIQTLDAATEKVNKANSLGKWATRSANKLDNLSKTVAGTGRKLMMLGGLVSAPFIAGTMAFATFEANMKEVATMLGDPDNYIPDFSDRIRKMSVEYGEGTATLSRGLYDILSASIPAEKAISTLDVSTRLAKAGLVDTGVAADVLTTILNSYSLSADRAEDVSDLLFTIVKSGKTTMRQLAPALGQVTSLAASAGVSLEEMGAALATMTYAGVQTDSAVTGLTAIISSFLNPVQDSIDALEELKRNGENISFTFDSMSLRTEGLYRIFQQISELPPDTVARLFPNVRALRGILPALQNMEQFKEKLDAMENRAGAMESAFATMFSGVMPIISAAKQTIIDIGVALGEGVQGPAKLVGLAIIGIGKALTFLISISGPILPIVAGLGVSAVTLGATMYGLAGAIKLVSMSLRGLLLLKNVYTWTVDAAKGVAKLIKWMSTFDLLAKASNVTTTANIGLVTAQSVATTAQTASVNALTGAVTKQLPAITAQSHLLTAGTASTIAYSSAQAAAAGASYSIVPASAASTTALATTGATALGASGSVGFLTMSLGALWTALLPLLPVVAALAVALGAIAAIGYGVYKTISYIAQGADMASEAGKMGIDANQITGGEDSWLDRSAAVDRLEETNDMFAETNARYEKLMQERAAAEEAAAQEAAMQAEMAEQAATQAEEQRLESIRSIIEALQEQVATYGMSEQELKRYELAQLGASDADMEAARALQEQANALERTQKLRDIQSRASEAGLLDGFAGGAGTTETGFDYDGLRQRAIAAGIYGEALANYNREVLLLDTSLANGMITQEQYNSSMDAQLNILEEAVNKHEQLAEAGKRVWESTRTPLERYEEEVRKLNELLAAGAISEDTYGRAVQQAYDSSGLGREEEARLEDLASRAQQVIDSTRTPMEQYERQITNLNELYNEGAIDWETYGRAVQEARDTLESNQPQQEDLSGPIDPGEFSTVSSYVDIAGLNMTQQRDPMADKLDSQTDILSGIRDAVQTIAREGGVQ